MKKIKEIVIPAVALFLICLIATALLGGTNLVTKDKIAQVAADTANQARFMVCADAVDFEPVECESGELYIAVDGDGNTVGYAVTTTDPKSYGGEIKVMTGFDAAGNVTGVEILSIDDTPGLGMNAKKESFRDQFNGKNIANGDVVVVKNQSSLGDNEINALTGATITSNAVTRCVNTAIEIVKTNMGGGN